MTGHGETPGHPGGQSAGQPGGQPGARRVARSGLGESRETAGQDATEAGQGTVQEVRIRTAVTRSSSGGGRTSALRLPSRRHMTADERRYWLSSRLTERDRELLRVLDRVGVLTAPQIAAMFFDSGSRARARLALLHDTLGVVERFRPHSPAWGSEPFHSVLGRHGAGVLAAERGDEPATAERRWSTGRMIALSGSQRLRHTVGVNGFFASLAGEARRGGGELARWMTEREAAKACGASGFAAGIVRPDGWAIWRDGGDELEFFLEYDRGTETLAALAAKLPGYESLEADRGVAAWVLFAFPTARREGTARRALAAATVAVATAALDGSAGPHEAVWAPLRGSEPRRHRLASLGRLPLPAKAVERAAAGGGRAWRFESDFYGDGRREAQPERRAPTYRPVPWDAPRWDDAVRTATTGWAKPASEGGCEPGTTAATCNGDVAAGVVEVAGAVARLG